MKLLNARIENFRLLKEVKIDFSTEVDRNLTIIRAANESGKTTLLTALQWGLFGDAALPDQGKNFRLSPLDTSSGIEASLIVSVAVEYKISARASTRTYRLIRSVTETVRAGEWERRNANINLLHLKSNGAYPIDNAKAHVRPHLPEELREVFFTDGDRALSFIEGSRGDQMKRVENAIRSLLGLGVIEDALDHVRKVSSSINQKVRKEGGNRNELDTATKRLAQLQNEIPELEKQVKRAKEARINLEGLEQEADRELSEALRKGNREELEKQRKAAIHGRQSAEKDSVQAAREHANLFRSKLLSKHLLSGPFAKANGILERLHSQGKIPSQTIPVLEDRLNQPVCICGESLDTNDKNGEKRRTHIRILIEDSRNSDEIQKKITALYYSSKELLRPIESRTWIDEYNDIFERRQRAINRCQQHGEAERAAEAKIAEIPNSDTRQLRDTRNRYYNQFKETQGEEIRLNLQLEAKQRDVKSAEADRAKFLQKDKRGLKFAAELYVAKDLQDIMSNALETMKTRELQKVSKYMNALFLDMIGVDVSQKAIITRAEITPDFRILVFGQYEQPLDPSQDLNGASRRALTIAFILALTKVSEVEAPNVIDTPLGMTSGYVKTAILKFAAQQSSQLILFLTHDEIKGCEDILDRYAGRVYTLTNPAHYPKILINEPGVTDTRVLLCDCNHRQHCEICERREAINMAEMNTDASAIAVEE